MHERLYAERYFHGLSRRNGDAVRSFVSLISEYSNFISVEMFNGVVEDRIARKQRTNATN